MKPSSVKTVILKSQVSGLQTGPKIESSITNVFSSKITEISKDLSENEDFISN